MQMTNYFKSNSLLDFFVTYVTVLLKLLLFPEHLFCQRKYANKTIYSKKCERLMPRLRKNAIKMASEEA